MHPSFPIRQPTNPLAGATTAPRAILSRTGLRPFFPSVCTVSSCPRVAFLVGQLLTPMPLLYGTSRLIYIDPSVQTSETLRFLWLTETLPPPAPPPVLVPLPPLGGRGSPANFFATHELPCSRYSARVMTRSARADLLSARLTPPCQVYFIGLYELLSDIQTNVSGAKRTFLALEFGQLSL